MVHPNRPPLARPPRQPGPELEGSPPHPQARTLLRWHRQGFRPFWKFKSRNGVGRPRVASETIALIQQMARENSLWGAERIRGELMKLGIRVASPRIGRPGSDDPEVHPSATLPPRPRSEWINFRQESRPTGVGLRLPSRHRPVLPANLRIPHHRTRLTTDRSLWGHLPPNRRLARTRTSGSHALWPGATFSDSRSGQEVWPSLRTCCEGKLN